MRTFDAAVDTAFDHLRGRPGVDAAAGVVSNLADYGFVWAVIAAAKGRRSGPARDLARRALTVAGLSSAVVNRAVKELVRRQRPGDALRLGNDGPVPVRAPTTPSFPSGHTLAAFCTAILLAESRRETVAFVAFAVMVGASRVQLKAHHPSDVVGGAALGVTLGIGGRLLLGRR
jgi:undecaprenyl-diphosphatase